MKLYFLSAWENLIWSIHSFPWTGGSSDLIWFDTSTCAPEAPPEHKDIGKPWTLHTDGSSSIMGSRAMLKLTPPDGGTPEGKVEHTANGEKLKMYLKEPKVRLRLKNIWAYAPSSCAPQPSQVRFGSSIREVFMLYGQPMGYWGQPVESRGHRSNEKSH